MYNSCEALGEMTPGETQAHAPVLAFRSLLEVVDKAGSAIRGAFPDPFWCEAQVVGVQSKASGYRIELIDPGSHDAGLAARLQGFLSNRVATEISDEFGFEFDPRSLVDTTVLLKVIVQWHRAHHLGLRITGLNPALSASLHKAQVDRLRAALQSAGIFDAQRRLTRPPDITGLAVIAPIGSAGLGDIEGDLGAWEAAGILSVHSVPAVFEGPRAAASITAVLNHCAALAAAGQVDVVLVVRGGGHKAGLVAASAENVVRAVLALPVPVVVGIGHARGLSLLDEAAWLSCSTPTKALGVARDLFARPAAGASHHWGVVMERLKEKLDHRIRPMLERERERLITAGRSVVAAESAALEGTRTALEFERAGLVVQVRQRRYELDDTAAKLGGDTRLCPAVQLEHVSEVFGGLATHLRAQLGRAAELIEPVPAQSDIDRLLAEQGRALDQLIERVREGTQSRIARASAELESIFAKLRVFDVDEMLAHGLALAVLPNGALLRSAAEAAAQAHFSLLFRDGLVAVAPECPSNATTH